MSKILPTLRRAANPTQSRDLADQANPLPWDWLLNASAEAVLIVDSVSEKIVEGNPAAARLFGTICTELVGSALLDVFEGASAQALGTCLARARAVGGADARRIRTLGGLELNIRVALFQAGATSFLLVRPAAHRDGEIKSEAGPRPSAAFRAIDDASVGFLVADAHFRVQYANRGFLTLIKLHSELAVKGRSLVRWLGLSAAQLLNLREQLWSRRAIADLVTTLRPEQEAPRTVEVSVVAVPDGRRTLWGFCVRERVRSH